MNPAKINALLDTLKAACSRQFRFNPRRVAAGMRYVGMEGQGANMVHVFRDSHTHSQIELKSTMATLREHHGDGHEKRHIGPKLKKPGTGIPMPRLMRRSRPRKRKSISRARARCIRIIANNSCRTTKAGLPIKRAAPPRAKQPGHSSGHWLRRMTRDWPPLPNTCTPRIRKSSHICCWRHAIWKSKSSHGRKPFKDQTAAR